MTTTYAPALSTADRGAAPPHVASEAASSQALCYHCGSALDAATALHGNIADQSHTFCCAGCQAIAQTLHASGMGHVYDGPIAFARPMDGDKRAEAEAVWATYDLPVMRERFVRARVDGTEEVSLAITGMRCAACVWLIERALSRVACIR